LFAYLIRRIRRSVFNQPAGPDSYAAGVLYFIFLAGLVFLGIRGRIAEKSPIRWGTAFFSQYNFTNQLGLNPVYTFIRSWLDQRAAVEVKYNFLDSVKAKMVLREQLGAAKYEGDSPVRRIIQADGPAKKFNVVLVLMESLSSKFMTRFGNENHLTPVIDSLYYKSISFSDFYSDGNHTFNGIFSSLYGWHALPMIHHMKDLTHQQPYSGLPVTLFNQGYNTVFFTTHDDQFDNMSGFLLPNGFERIISEKDFPDKYILSTLGVPDHILFDRVLLELDTLGHQAQPFFAALITGSNHEPFVIPDGIGFEPRSAEMKHQIVEYSDWAIGKFLADASSRPWFDSTVFVFTGDHGGLVQGFNHYLAFHHVPLMIYAPKVLAPRELSSVGGQADIFPTVCGLLNLSYVNNSMGVDLLRQQRRYFPFNFDEEMCCISKDYFFTIGHDNEHFYSLSDDKSNLQLTGKNTEADSMKVFTQAVLQITQQLIENRKMR
jgi:phosphoglycerol transferase MdoB-like AlkP superfamily enzyme